MDNKIKSSVLLEVRAKIKKLQLTGRDIDRAIKSVRSTFPGKQK